PARGLVVSAEATNNAVLERHAMRIAPALEHGASLSDSLASLRFFPPMFTGMVSTGDQTGNMDQMLDKAAEYYENEALHASMQLIIVLGVVMLLGMAVLVGMKVIGFYTNMYGGMAGAGGGQ